jgi:hypothetical protein
MSRYERAYGTDWTTLDSDAAIERAYALGVATTTGEYHPEELEAIRAEMDTAYAKSVVDLAFDEGKNEAKAAAPEGDAVWDALVAGEGEVTTVDEDDVPTGGKQGLPDAIAKLQALDRPEMDRTGSLDLPEFLEKD